ncbi:MAG: 16S rRNA (cytidine(1402)-2'-O)-methyltransferase, partial [Methylovulum sp.]|nr:16S rRNA (cytidine(1402)-2'-O)-methyltransferase [Methylovulum sp.]
LEKTEQEVSPEHLKILGMLLKECPLKTAVALAVEITGGRKKLLYQAALDMQDAE